MTTLVGSEAPVALRATVFRAAGSVADFTTITSASIRVRLPRLTASPDEAYLYLTWVPSVTIVTASEVRLVYPFAAGGADLPRVGVYGLAIDLTLPAGVVPCDPCNLPVIDRF